MPDIDTSSYPRPQQGQNPLDIAGKLQGLESNRIGIDQQKLQLANQHFQIVNQTLGSLLYKPDLTADDIISESQKLVNLGLMTPEHNAQFVSAIPGKAQLKQDPQALQKYLTVTRNQALSNMEALNWYGGQPTGFVNSGNAQYPTASVQGKTVITPGVVPSQLPVTTPGFQPPSKQFPTGREAPIGPSPNMPAGPSGFPGQAPAAPQGPMGGAVSGATPVPTTTIRKPALPVASSGLQQPPTVQQRGLPTASAAPPEPIRQPGAFEPTDFNNRFGASQTLPGSPPFGFKAASEAAGQASGDALAQARNHAANFQREIFPLTQAIPALERLGTKGTGPGTETFNQIKSFILTNVPGVTEKQLSSVKDVDEAKKYLVDFVNQTGATGTNDKLAAAFSGNPSINISNAAAQDVAKSALALRLMQQAQYLKFENSKQPDNMFSKWSAQENNQLDPRAFGVNYMSPEAKATLLQQLKKNPKEFQLFERSLKVAKDAGYIVLGQPNQ